jgi:Flp pilus assembly protein TadD
VEPISAALRAGDFDHAVELTREALKEHPNNPQLWTLQGIAYASKGTTKEALAAFQQALKISPNNIAALAGAAQIEHQTGSQAAVPLLNHLAWGVALPLILTFIGLAARRNPSSTLK